MAAYDSILELIGNTPLVDVSTLSPKRSVRVLAKLEGQNPGGSVKDRAAKAMIEEAEKGGVSFSRAPHERRQVVLVSHVHVGLALQESLHHHPMVKVLSSSSSCSCSSSSSSSCSSPVSSSSSCPRCSLAGLHQEGGPVLVQPIGGAPTLTQETHHPLVTLYKGGTRGVP